MVGTGNLVVLEEMQVDLAACWERVGVWVKAVVTVAVKMAVVAQNNPFLQTSTRRHFQQTKQNPKSEDRVVE